ncbi:MazG-like family protein [Sphaerochaeta globosa]|uniref:Helix-turn-helix domain protein n=1 Tax=Sphaerochaeta globosa (strain ATCC BAA-1886 / DSM 22777 / Buddy) TaxID=158189 RepID=F0RTE2_SPHGB|nr:MazG-like family protein [Sphaerochaeta globosa]ADY14424.1 helix-turn-helix domain protein [Sphaerochaeta globosa str. Buddy]
MTTTYTRILDIRKQLQLSPSEMAEKLGLSEQDYLIGIEFPSASLIEQLCSVFGLSHQYLTEGVGPMFTERPLPIAEILAFRDARNWKQFHTPKDLSISLSLEAAELLECFQWSGSDVEAKSKQAQMEEELADILIYSVLFADAIGVDIPTIIHNKLKKNGEKYAVAKAFGNAKKYTEFSETD